MVLQVIFDRQDHRYRFGELVSGKVVVMPESERTFSNIWITYRWRTHGRGNRDEGREEKLNLGADNITIKARESKEFPFRFTAPNGPVTYHGHLINVDWYLTAHARSGYSFHRKCEQDFLLQSSDPTGAVILGDEEIPYNDLPARSSRMQTPSSNLLEVKSGSPKTLKKWFDMESPSIPIIVGGIFFLVWVFKVWLNWNPELPLEILLFTLFIITLAAWLFYRNAYKHKLKMGEVWLRPCVVFRGGEVSCHIEFVAKREFHLRSITASISSQERISRTQGTSTVTETHVLGEKVYTRSYNENLSEGRWISFDCTLPIGPDAPASFSSNNNHLEWSVKIKAELKGWPAWWKSFTMTVLP